MGLVCLNWPKSKLVLLIVTMKLDKSLNQSFHGDLEKIGYTSCNRPIGNCYKIQNQHLIGHVLGGQNGGSTNMLLFGRDHECRECELKYK